MSSTLRPAHPDGNVRTSELWSEQPSRKLGARAHVELRVDVRQVAGNGALPEKERRRDLPVRLPLRNENRDPALALRQVAARRRAAPDPAELGAGLVRPERRAETLEDGLRCPQRRACVGAPLRPPLCRAKRKERPGVLERIRRSGVLSECRLEARGSALEIASRREQQPTRPPEDRERRGATEPFGPFLPGREDLIGAVELADADESLEKVAELQPLTRLEHEVGAQLVRASELRERRARVAERELEEAYYPGCGRHRD